MSINLKTVFPVACFLAWLFFVVSCEEPAEPIDPPVDVIPDTTIIIGSGDTITVPIDTIIASFSFTNNNCTAICSLSFTNASYNATSYLWDFGDPILGEPSTSTAANPSHSYKTSGTFLVVLKATRGTQSSTYTQMVTITRPNLPYTIGTAKSEYGNGVVQTTDGGYMVVGSRQVGNGNLNVYLFKTDASRNVLWESNFGGSANDRGYAIEATPDGDFIIAGYTESTGAGLKDIYLIRANAAGGTKWRTTIGGAGTDEGLAVALSNDGGFVVLGSTQDDVNNTNKDVVLAKTDAYGNLLWEKRFDPGGPKEAYCIQATPDGGYLIGGFNSSFPTNLPPFEGVSYLVKTDGDGNILWENDDIPNLFHIKSIGNTADGGFILAGLRNKYTDLAHIILAKINADGTLEWSKSDYTSGALYDEVNRIRQTSDGGYILCGAADASPYQTPARKDILVIKTDGAGNEIWAKRFRDGAEYGAGYDIRETADGGYIVAGSLLVELVEFVSSDFDVYLLKLDANGNAE
ncbi:MAG TPA: PKD domain-containing protein [Saprospiraceae bacterium]|nr:PKD domain-containing protein [Saprospiraceae bacterium]HPI06174.1 PKD domain-containing protein [Saprospiraceae bacterium]